MTKYAIDTTTLRRFKLTPNQYLFLMFVATNNESEYIKFRKDIPLITIKEVTKFIDIGYLSSDISEPKFKDLKITESGKNILELNNTDIFFEEFWKLFPTTTPSGRKLKQITKRKVYVLYTKCHENKQEEHEKILKLLEKEIQDRLTRGRMNYMQSVEVWLRNKSYLAYAEDDEPTEELYGGKLF